MRSFAVPEEKTPPAKDDEACAAEIEDLLDEALEESFPASDPISPGVGPGQPIKGRP
jgi:hypothetical protein